MFRKNTGHQQKSFLGNLNDLPSKQQQRLEQSWAGTFYDEIFSRIDEAPYAALYADKPSRPNIAVNILVGLEILKAGKGWSDEEMYDNFCYNIQTRHALGLHTFTDGHFELRTVYLFRRRLSEHMQETGENLFEQTFEEISAEKLQKFSLKSNHQRVDSTQIASNIRELNRLQLLIEILQRTHRMLSEADQARFQSDFAPYVKGTAGQFTYRLKGKGAHRPHLESIGKLMAKLVDDLAIDYKNHADYRLLKRVFNEHFNQADDETSPKDGHDLSAKNLQSPDDPDATYRSKRGEGHIGYVANLTETSHEENDFQLILKVQIEPNTADDAKLLAEIVPDLKEKYGLEDLYADGGYGSAEVDNLLAEHGIKLHQTALRGRKPSANTFDLAACNLHINAADDRTLQKVTTPEGDEMLIEPGRKSGRYILRYPANTRVSDPPTGIYLSQAQVNVALRRQGCAQVTADGKNPRAAVEATIGAVKRPFGNDKVPVRGKFRTGMMVIGSAMMVNLRRIHRFRMEVRQAATENTEDGGSEDLLLAFLRRAFAPFLARCGFAARFSVIYA
jgi:hypothetical protein